MLQRLQYIKCNIQAIEDTCWLQKYLKEFPLVDKSKATTGSLWLDEYAYLDTQIGDPEEIQDPKNQQYESKALTAQEASRRKPSPY